MKFDVVIQARMGSNRMHGKVLKIYKNFSILDILIKRVKKLNLINKIIVSTTIKKKDDKIVAFCKKNKILYFRGSEKNVLSRYYKTAVKFKLKNCKITSDCPLIDINALKKMIKNYKKFKVDFYQIRFRTLVNFQMGLI